MKKPKGIEVSAEELRYVARNLGIVIDREYIVFLLQQAAKRIDQLEKQHGAIDSRSTSGVA